MDIDTLQKMLEEEAVFQYLKDEIISKVDCYSTELTSDFADTLRQWFSDNEFKENETAPYNLINWCRYWLFGLCVLYDSIIGYGTNTMFLPVSDAFPRGAIVYMDKRVYSCRYRRRIFIAKCHIVEQGQKEFSARVEFRLEKYHWDGGVWGTSVKTDHLADGAVLLDMPISLRISSIETGDPGMWEHIKLKDFTKKYFMEFISRNAKE